MAEIKEVKTEKTTVNAGERIHVSFEFWYEQDILTISRMTTRYHPKESEEIII